MRATSVAGMRYSSRLRHAKATNVRKAPMKAKAASHQMCQIMAKPKKNAKKAHTTPVGLFRPQRVRLEGALFCHPIGIPAVDPWKHGEVEGRRRRGRRPLERAPVPGIARHIAKLLPIAEAHD